MRTIPEQIRSALRRAAEEARSTEERDAFELLALRISDRAAQKLRGLIR